MRILVAPGEDRERVEQLLRACDFETFGAEIENADVVVCALPIEANAPRLPMVICAAELTGEVSTLDKTAVAGLSPARRVGVA